MTGSGLSLGALIQSLPPGGAAYVDRDWLCDEPEVSVVSALVHDPGRGFRWSAGQWREPGADTDPDIGAWQCFDALARSVVAAAGRDQSVLVEGRGLLASQVRAQLAGRALDRAIGVADVAIDTTAQAEGLLAATSAVADLGTVLLAATPLDATLPFDLYHDVHRRGLRVVGVPDPDVAGGVSGAPPGFRAPGSLDATSRLDGSQWFVMRP